jgi:hypothetical protein
LAAYIAAFLPTAPFFTSNDSRISAVCYDQYSSTLAILEQTGSVGPSRTMRKLQIAGRAGDDQAPSPTVNLETLPPVGAPHLRLQDFSLLLSSAKLACAGWYAHIEIFYDSISETA